MSIDRDNPLPLHSQLTDIIKSRIKLGTYPPGTRLPSEREICEEFSISRTTVRETLRQLKKEGLIHVMAGRGAFIKPPKRDITVQISLDGYTSDLQRLGKDPSSKLLSAGVILSPDKNLVERMGLLSGDEVIRVERLRLNENNPLALHTVYLNHRFCPQILDHNLSHISLFSSLRDKYGLKIRTASEEIFAALATPQERKLLSLPHPSAVLQCERTTFLENGQVIEYSRATYCGEFYRLVMNLDAKEEKTG
jgi:GntR family transcriptional regulator